MSLFTIIALLMLAVLMAIGIKAHSPAMSSIISICLCIAVASMCIARVGQIIDYISSVFGQAGTGSEYLKVLLKLMGIAYICDFASNISKDAGYGAVATEIELLGKLSMLLISMPILMRIIDMVLAMMR